MKKLLSLIFCAVLILACSLIIPLRADAARQGDYIYNVSGGKAVISEYIGSGDKVTIPSALGGYPVTTIGDSAFQDCDSLTSVTIPNSVTTIGTSAFQDCCCLTSVTIPNSVTTIESYAFWSCDSLTSVTIPNSVTTIGDSAFCGCDSLTSVTIPNSVTTIAGYAFCSCDSLTSVTIPASVTKIGEDAFYSCDSLTAVYYAGTAAQWDAIAIAAGNKQLCSAQIVYNTYRYFPDVKPGAWYYNAVQFAVKNGYFSGNGDGTFGAGNNITRQDFVVVLSRIAGADLSKYSGKTAFTDVPSGAYYAKAIHWATANGVISGYNATKFGVGDPLTREQLVTIFSRYAAKKGVNVTPNAAALSKLNGYKDAKNINPAMKNAVAWALQNKVISGMTATTIAPQGKATRAQVAAILMNINAYKIIPGI